ncbi:S1C family serine protease [Kutzneria kofuensis]|uniref:Putative serine protease PepD n=1 Tax=Kutzneria kofuensis TaxID=103725 RepID=A0A7W9NF83_9PSEU|nr:trypsin-like peptidase domain-containing protein [Kutzneria kofuensis]MBB5889733.1 putative serine protease PepD [Kutzneria kofuensis]
MTETPRTQESPVFTDDTPTPPTGFQNPLFVPPQPQPPRRARKGTAALVGAAVLAAVVGGGTGAWVTSSVTAPSTVSSSVSGTASGTPAANNTASGNVSSVAAAGLPVVVKISNSQGLGSGVIISSDGLILTNNHVVATGGPFTVTFNDGSKATAAVVGTDPSTDLAVIKAQGVSGLKTAVFADSSTVKVGDQVVAIGAPEGLQGTVTSGIVSALNRTVTAGSDNSGNPYAPSGKTTYKGAIQTDASINPGNSGGPLFNMQGQVIGINSSIYSPTDGSIGLGFAIPSNTAKSVAQQLVANGN